MIKSFSDFRYVDPFRRYSRSKSKVVRNRAEFWTIIALSLGEGLVVVARRLKKFREDTPISLEVIDSNMLNFRPNLKFS